MPDNTVTLVGNATRDPELTFLPSGQSKAQFGIAINRRKKEGDEWVDGEPSFFNIVVFGSTAENVAESIGKGTRVIVEGRVEQRSYETTEGEKRTVVEVIADSVGPDLRWASAVVTRNERS